MQEIAMRGLLLRKLASLHTFQDIDTNSQVEQEKREWMIYSEI